MLDIMLSINYLTGFAESLNQAKQKEQKAGAKDEEDEQVSEEEEEEIDEFDKVSHDSDSDGGHDRSHSQLLNDKNYAMNVANKMAKEAMKPKKKIDAKGPQPKASITEEDSPEKGMLKSAAQRERENINRETPKFAFNKTVLKNQKNQSLAAMFDENVDHKKRNKNRYTIDR